jgi:NitT/TauT family transport system substrate-binding protein
MAFSERWSRRSVLAGAGAACAAAPLGLAAQSLIHLSVGTVPTDAGLGPVIAQRGDFYRRNGLDVDVQFMNSGAAMSAAMVGGSLQIGGAPIMSLILSHAKGLPFQIVGPGNMYVSTKPSELLVVRKDSLIRSAADLNGKVVASPALGDFFSITMHAWVDQNGGDSRTLREIELPTAGTPAAIAAGRIDAAVLPEPVLSQTLNSGLTRILGKPYDAIAPRFPIACNFALPEFIDANRDAIQHFYRAMVQANAFGNAHPDQTAPWLAEVTKVDAATINRGHREVLAEGIDVALVQRVIDAAARYKAIDHAFDAHDMISPVVLNLKA